MRSQRSCRATASGIAFALTAFSLLCAVTHGTAGTFTKYWYKGHGAVRGWDYQYTDQWQGKNFWCVGSGADCFLYDWKAVYPLGTIGAPPTPSGTNTGAYGDQLIAAAAAAANMTLPGDLPPAEYHEIYDATGIY